MCVFLLLSGIQWGRTSVFFSMGRWQQFENTFPPSLWLQRRPTERRVWVERHSRSSIHGRWKRMKSNWQKKKTQRSAPNVWKIMIERDSRGVPVLTVSKNLTAYSCARACPSEVGICSMLLIQLRTSETDQNFLKKTQYMKNKNTFEERLAFDIIYQENAHDSAVIYCRRKRCNQIIKWLISKYIDKLKQEPSGESQYRSWRGASRIRSSVFFSYSSVFLNCPVQS